MLRVFPTNPFCTVGLLPLAPHLTSCGAFGPTTLICQCDPHPQHFCHVDTVTLTEMYGWLTHDTVVHMHTGVIVAS